MQVHYVPIHHHPVYADLGFGPEDLPDTERGRTPGCSPCRCTPTLTDADQDTVVRTPAGILEELG